MSRREHPVEASRSATQSDTGGDVVALWLITAYLLLIIVGFGFYRSGHATIAGNPMSLPRSLFTAVNAATLTGFQQSVQMSSLTSAGQAMTAVLMIGGTFLIMSSSTIAVARILRKTWSVPFILLSCATAQFLATVVGGAIVRSPGQDLSTAMFHAASAFGNCGLVLGRLSGADNALTFAGLLPLAILGSLGLPVLIESFDSIFRSTPLSRHSRVVLMSTAVAFLVGLVGCVWLLRVNDVPVQTSLASGLIASINSRTAGLPIEYVYDYPRAMQWWLIGLMFIGGAPASAASGLKLTTIVVLCAGLRRTFRNEPAGRAFGIALAWFGVYLLLAFASMLWLLNSAPEISSDRALFITISAISNTGLSPDPLSVTAANGYVLASAMLLGRVLPIGVLWWMAWTTRDAEIAVG